MLAEFDIMKIVCHHLAVRSDSNAFHHLRVWNPSFVPIAADSATAFCPDLFSKI